MLVTVIPPKLTVEPPMTKLVPLIVSAKAALPATALLGEIAVTVGVGLSAELDPLGGAVEAPLEQP
jgi:hypothetical protein